MIDKIQKLIKKARDEATTEAEAIAIMAKVSQMLLDNNLSMTDVDRETSEIIEEHCDLRYADPWRRSIVFAAARLYFCEALNTEVRRNRPSRKKFAGNISWDWVPSFSVFGKKHNTVVAVEMIRYLTDTVVRLSRDYSSVRSEQLAFQRGCGERIAERLILLRHQRSTRRAAEFARSGGTDLVVVEETEVREHIDKIKAPKGKPVRGSDTEGSHAAAGAAAGDSVSLAPQVAGQDGGGPLRLEARRG